MLTIWGCPAKKYKQKSNKFDKIMKQSQSLPIDLIAYLFTGNIIDLFPQVSIFFKQVWLSPLKIRFIYGHLDSNFIFFIISDKPELVQLTDLIHWHFHEEKQKARHSAIICFFFLSIYSSSNSSLINTELYSYFARSFGYKFVIPLVVLHRGAHCVWI